MKNIDVNLVILIMQMLVVLGSYLIGKYVIPNLSSNDLTMLTYVTKWVEQFVKEAGTFTDMTGAERKQYVAEQVSALLKKNKIELSAEQISALIESAYMTCKKAIEEANKDKNKNNSEEKE